MRQQNWPRAAGEAASLIRAYDWSRTPLGPLTQWPQYMRTPVDLALRSPVPIVLLWGPTGIMIYNDAYAGIAGSRHPELLGQPVLEGWPEVAAFNAHVLEVCLGGEALAYKDQHLVLHRDGVPEDMYFDLNYSAIPDDYGKPAAVFAIVADTTDRVKARQALRLANERLELALDAGPIIGTFIWDVRSERVVGDERFARAVGVASEAIRAGVPLPAIVDVVHPDDRERNKLALQRAIANGDPYRLEYRIRQGNGAYLWVEASGHCERDEAGAPIRFPGVLIDTSKRRKHEQHLQYLLRELTHRSKNLLSVVKSIAGQTARGAASVADFYNRFDGRLQALAKLHDSLVRTQWSGARLMELVTLQLEPFRNAEHGMTVEGPDVTANAEAAQSIGLALHELATNAAKYGALSRPDGTVSVTWRVYRAEGGGDRLELVWREAGGPVVALPTRRGFGSAMIERMPAATLSGSSDLDFRPDGVVWRLDVPATCLVGQGDADATR